MESLKQIRKMRNLSQEDVAKYLGMSRSMYSFYENGRFTPSEAIVARLAEFYDLPVDVMSGKVNLDKAFVNIEPIETKMVKIPIVGHVRAGYNEIVDNNIDGYMDVEESLTKRFPGCFSINVYGDSMEPEIHNGDRVIVQPCSTVDSGSVAIICLNGDEATIKRVRFDDNGLTIIPTNPKYKSMTYTAEQVEMLPVTICGRVIQVRHDYY